MKWIRANSFWILNGLQCSTRFYIYWIFSWNDHWINVRCYLRHSADSLTFLNCDVAANPAANSATGEILLGIQLLGIGMPCPVLATIPYHRCRCIWHFVRNNSHCLQSETIFHGFGPCHPITIH